MMNNPNLKAGSVRDLGEKGYSIAVVTQDGAPVTERVIMVTTDSIMQDK